MGKLSKSARRVQEALKKYEVDLQVLELPHSTRTAVEAAEAVRCDVGQICKSLIFETQETRRPLLVITSGSNRVNESALSQIIGEPIQTASPDDVREITGFSIGGVAPVGLRTSIPTYIDQDLLQYREIWAAAGTPHAVFKVTPAQLQKITEGEVISVL